MSDRQVSPTAKALMQAWERINTEDKWCVGALINGKGQRCALGALLPDDAYYEPYENGLPVTPPWIDSIYDSQITALADALDRMESRNPYNPYYGNGSRNRAGRVATFNNCNVSGHDGVKRMFDTAIQAELNKGREESKRLIETAVAA